MILLFISTTSIVEILKFCIRIGILISHIVPENLSSSVILAGFMIQKRPNQYIIEISHALAEYLDPNISLNK